MNIRNIFVQKELLRERAMPFVSQMFGLVMEAESVAGSALAFGLCCSVGEGRQAGGPRRAGPGSKRGFATRRPGK